MPKTGYFSETEPFARFPRLVNRVQFGILKRLMARIDRAHVGNNVFLGYCKIHACYYLDYNHTNGEIRCPICDKKWSIKQRNHDRENNGGPKQHTR